MKKENIIESITILIILGIALILRFSSLKVIGFQADEAGNAELAYNVFRGNFPLTGLATSTGIMHFPLLIYILSIPFLLSNNIIFGSLFICFVNIAAILIVYLIGKKYYNKFIGIMSSVLFAVSPWAVHYSIYVWSQDVMIPLLVFLYWALISFIKTGKGKSLMCAVFLSFYIFQLHFTAVTIFLVIIAVIIIKWRSISIKHLLLGILIGIIPMIPFFIYQEKTGFKDIKNLLLISKKYIVRTEAPGTFSPDGSLYRTKNPFNYTIGTVNDGYFQDILGFDKEKFYKKVVLEKILSIIEQIILVLAIIYLFILFTFTIVMRKKPYSNLNGKNIFIKVFPLIWILIQPIFLVIFGFGVTASYFVIIYPACYFAISIFLYDLASLLKFKKYVLIIIFFSFSLITFSQIFFNVKFNGFLKKNGGTRGSYNVLYSYKYNIVEYILSETNGKIPIIYDKPSDANPLNREYQYLINYIRNKKYKNLTVSENKYYKQKIYFIINTLSKNSLKMEKFIQKKGTLIKNFGPLKLHSL